MSFARLGPDAEQPASRGQSPVSTTPPVPTTFDQLGLTPELLRSVASQGYTEPTPVQAQSIPIVLAGRDLLASAQTGTGKTAAFVLPILQLLNATRPAPRPASPSRQRLRGATGLPIRCLVLTPTRELALQIEESVRTYGSARPVRSTTIYGGVGFQPQVVALKHGPEIVVATPGRLLDHVGRATIDLSSVEILVLDEADRMLDMGFIHDIRRVLALLPERRQNLLFSATFSDEIRELSGTILKEAAEVQVARRNAPIELVRQVVHPVDRERKRELLTHLIQSGRIDRALVFTRTKHGANRLAEQLGGEGIAAAAIHGNKSQSQRVGALNDFKNGRVAILVATEIAARGLDIDGLPHVVNYELPTVPEDYVHRIGRTGRAGMEGDAVSLVCIDESHLLDEIQRLLRQPIRHEVIAGFEIDRSIRREPIRLRSNDVRVQAPGRRGPAAPRPSFGSRRSVAQPPAGVFKPHRIDSAFGAARPARVAVPPFPQPAQRPAQQPVPARGPMQAQRQVPRPYQGQGQRPAQGQPFERTRPNGSPRPNSRTEPVPFRGSQASSRPANAGPARPMHRNDRPAFSDRRPQGQRSAHASGDRNDRFVSRPGEHAAGRREWSD